jgi:hypothetical protein
VFLMLKFPTIPPYGRPAPTDLAQTNLLGENPNGPAAVYGPLGRAVSVSMHDLRVGDLVRCHGLTVVVDLPPKVSTGHGMTSGGLVMYATARVLHRADDQVPLSWIRPDRRNPHRIVDERDRWTLQGNGFARHQVWR